MTVSEAIKAIESPEFCAYVNAASSMKVFLRLLSRHEAVQTLLDALEQPGEPQKIADRVSQLCQIEPEEDLEHPSDAAVAAYLWLLSVKSPDLAELAAADVSRCGQCWWSRKLADQIATAQSVSSEPTSPPSHRP